MRDALPRSQHCYVCGTDNPTAFKLAPHREGKKVVLAYTPAPGHRGFSNTIHGGVTATLLDEVIGHAAGILAEGKAATVELKITYKSPVRVGQAVRVEGWCHRRRGRYIYGQGRVLSLAPADAGKVLAEGKGRFVVLDERLLGRFIGDR